MQNRLEVVSKPLLETDYGFDGFIDVRGKFVTNHSNTQTLPLKKL
jgi:hypothetical protein